MGLTQSVPQAGPGQAGEASAKKLRVKAPSEAGKAMPSSGEAGCWDEMALEPGSERREDPQKQQGGRSSLRPGNTLWHILSLFSQIFTVLLLCIQHLAFDTDWKGDRGPFSPSVPWTVRKNVSFAFRHPGNICAIVKVKQNSL